MVDEYRVRAHNMATTSANKIHDDAIAREYGFAGGLVPGVEVYAYMTHPVVQRLGRDWLTGGSMHVRLRRPVYDGREASVTTRLAGDEHGTLEVALHDEAGVLCAEGTARPAAARPIPTGTAPRRSPSQPAAARVGRCPCGRGSARQRDQAIRRARRKDVPRRDR